MGSHFNTAFVLLARSAGIPARAVIGYTVKPDVEMQYVLPQQAYMYAEVEFQNLGWVTFDACPIHYTGGKAEHYPAAELSAILQEMIP